MRIPIPFIRMPRGWPSGGFGGDDGGGGFHIPGLTGFWRWAMSGWPPLHHSGGWYIECDIEMSRLTALIREFPQIAREENAAAMRDVVAALEGRVVEYTPAGVMGGGPSWVYCRRGIRARVPC